jgi:hypothetical protein
MPIPCTLDSLSPFAEKYIPQTVEGVEIARKNEVLPEPIQPVNNNNCVLLFLAALAVFSFTVVLYSSSGGDAQICPAPQPPFRDFGEYLGCVW